MKNLRDNVKPVTVVERPNRVLIWEDVMNVNDKVEIIIKKNNVIVETADYVCANDVGEGKILNCSVKLNTAERPKPIEKSAPVKPDDDTP